MKNDVPIYLDAICLRKLDFSLFSVTIVQALQKLCHPLKLFFPVLDVVMVSLSVSLNCSNSEF
jgi:hypothetical protein